MKEDLFDKIAHKDEFKVPEGYFENVTSEIMKKISDQEKAGKPKLKIKPIHWLKPALCVAAMTVGIIFIIKTMQKESLQSPQITAFNDQEIDLTSDEFIDATMLAHSIDDYSFYLYLTDSEE